MHQCSVCNDHDLCVSVVPIFMNLSYEEQLEVNKLAKTRKYEKGSYLYQAGNPLNTLSIIHAGSIKISRYSVDGNEQIIHILKPGDFIGESSFLTNETTNDYAIALSDVEVCQIDGNKFKEHIKDKPNILIQILLEISKRLVKTEEKVEEITLLSADKRIVKSILSYEKDDFDLSISKGEWANELGIKFETLSRSLRTLKNEKLIDLKGQRKIIILDRNLLEDILYE